MIFSKKSNQWKRGSFLLWMQDNRCLATIPIEIQILDLRERETKKKRKK